MKIRTKEFVIQAVCVFSMISCENREQGYIRSIDKKDFYNNNDKNWQITHEFDDNYRIDKIDADTVKTLLFSISEDDKPSVYTYKMVYPCNLNDTCHLEMSFNDTLFFYRQNLGIKEFIQGEYAYQFLNLRMDAEEANFYMLYEDSLKKIKGSNLPALPRLSPVETQKLNEKLKKD